MSPKMLIAAAMAALLVGSGLAPSVAASADSATTTLYSQNDNSASKSANSQNFEPGYEIYDDAAADDFTTPTDVLWVVQEVVVSGVYFGDPAGPAESETVTFYRDRGGIPGRAIRTVTATGADSGGNFVIPVGGVKLKPGKTYWISVVANQSSVNGSWSWMARTVQSSTVARWRNPGNGGFTSCTTWSFMYLCLGLSGAPDLMFALNGKTQPRP